MASILQRLLFGISCFLVVLPTRSKVSTQGCSHSPSTCCMANGTGVFYDPTRFICCEGKLNRRDDPNKLYCCGQILYSPASSICCNNVLTNFKTAYLRPSCCRGVGYDADKFLCCQGRVTKKTFDNPGCCAGKELDNTRQICCQGKIQPSSEGRTSCCGSKSFNPHKDTCCKKTVYANIVTKTCCGNKPFDPSLSTCCNNQLTSKPRLSCCVKKAYNKTTHTCCGNVVKRIVNKNDTHCCCNKKSCTFYDKNKKICCDGKVISRLGHLGCCGRDIYDVRSQVCCGSIPLGISTNNWRCCGGKPYNKDRQICCRGHTHPKTGRRTRCCGNKGYEPSRFQCEDYLISRVTPIKDKNCGGRLYNPDRQKCCAKTVIPKIHGLFSECCGKKVYDRRLSICCDGRLATLSHGFTLPQCCRSRPFDASQQKCDVVTGDIAKRSAPHVKYCGSKMVEYDSKKLSCCQGKVKPLPGNGADFKCCAEEPHTDSFLCCHGNLVSKQQATACCGTIGYNSSTHACCQGKVHSAGYTCCKGVVHPTPGTEVGKGKCCAGIGYNDKNQICCKNIIFPKASERIKCCGNRPFDPSRNHTCCHESLSMSSHSGKSCCGRVSFNPNEDTCCRGRIYRKQKGSCCRKNIYNSSKEICCERNVYPKEKYGNKCYCGGELFNIQSSIKCCHGRIYHGRMFRCKKKQIVARGRMTRRLCDQQNNVAFVGIASPSKKNSIVITQVLKGKTLQTNDTVMIPGKQLRHRRVTLQQGKAYFVIGRLSTKLRTVVKHTKIYQHWNKQFQPNIEAILKTCYSTVYRSVNFG